MKKLYVVSATMVLLFFFAACGGNNSSSNQSQQEAASADTQETAAAAGTEAEGNPSYDPHRGEGKFHDYDPGAINPKLAAVGKEVYEAKCQSCHKLSDEMLVGPGWKGVTKKHTADWILNFISNPDAMLDQDPHLLEQIEICMVRMPNQNLSDEDAEGIYDFMRQNDEK